jgi:hypothetical protein
LKSFSEVYKLDETVVGEESGQVGMLETYGKDYEKLKVIMETSPNKVWTICDSEDSDEVIVVAGWHYVNRIAYLVTDKEFKSEDECYLDD